jgi:hypothetical protein
MRIAARVRSRQPIAITTARAGMLSAPWRSLSTRTCLLPSESTASPET